MSYTNCVFLFLTLLTITHHQCTEGANYCSQCTSNACTTCQPNYYVSQSVCLKCYSICLTCSQFMDCTSCYDGYYFSSSILYCYRCPSKCKTCVSYTSCTSCSDGYYLNQTSCLSCSNGCKTCADSINCLSCLTGYYP